MVCRLFYHVAKITEVPQQHWILYIVAQRDAFLVDVQTSAVTEMVVAPRWWQSVPYVDPHKENFAVGLIYALKVAGFIHLMRIVVSDDFGHFSLSADLLFCSRTTPCMHVHT